MTETAPERLGAIRTALAELVDEHGADLLSNPARMSNLIKDLLPDDQQLARILVIAAEQDVASKLREHVSQGMDAATATRLVATSFAASTMFAPQACLWVFKVPAGFPEPFSFTWSTGTSSTTISNLKL